MSVVVGVLTIDLVANTSSFTTEMGKASHLAARSATDIKRSLEKLAAVGLAMGTAIAAGTATLIEGSLDAADKLGKLAEASGTTARHFPFSPMPANLQASRLSSWARVSKS